VRIVDLSCKEHICVRIAWSGGYKPAYRNKRRGLKKETIEKILEICKLIEIF
jgi:hypothetical protein